MSWESRALAARAAYKSRHNPMETKMSEQVFPKHAKMYFDSDRRLIVKQADGQGRRVAEAMRLLEVDWGKEAMRRLSMFAELQSSLASALLVVKKLQHSKTKAGALNSADDVALNQALSALRYSRGNTDVAIPPGTGQHAVSFMDTIDKAFQATAEAATAKA